MFIRNLTLLHIPIYCTYTAHAVISGFTTGAAVIIGMSQVKYIVGYDVERSDQLHEIIGSLIANIAQFNWKTFLMGTGSIALLMLMKHIGKMYKNLSILRAIGPLTVTVLSIILTVTLHLDQKGIPIIAYIPKGFPSFTGREWFPIQYAAELYMIVLSIVIVGFMESIAIAKTLASKHKYEIDASMELIGLGMSNFMGSMFQSYPVTGSFSRSAVNNDSGAQSGIAGIITATLVGFTLLLLTPVFEKLPLCVLAAIVISGVLGLLDYDEAIYLWKVHKFDLGVWMTACLGTMFLGVEIGLAIAVAVSLLIVIYESAYPHTAVLGRLPGTNIYRNVTQYPQGERYDGIVIVRIDASLYFANAQNVRDAIRKYRLQAQEELDQTNATSTTSASAAAGNNGGRTTSTVRYIILDLAPVGSVDTSAMHILTDMHETYFSRGQRLCFSNPNSKVMERMILSGFADKVERINFFCSIQDAVHYCLDEMDAESVDANNSSAFQDEMETQQPLLTTA
jgi:sulfate transporter 4